MGLHKFILGDSMSFLDNMNDNCIDVTFTSPPYNRKRNDTYDLYNDTIKDYFTFLCKLTNNLLRVTTGHVFINIQKNYYNKNEVFKYIGQYSEQIVEIITWGKTNPVPASGGSITNTYEWVIVLHKKKKPLKANTTYTKNLIVTNVNVSVDKKHRAVMRQDVCDWFFEKFMTKGDRVLDPFLGLGTTTISAEKYGLDCVGIEIVPEYLELAKERYKIKEENE